MAGAERVFEILDNEEEKADREDSVEMEHPAGELTFRTPSGHETKIAAAAGNLSLMKEKGCYYEIIMSQMGKIV